MSPCAAVARPHQPRTGRQLTRTPVEAQAGARASEPCLRHAHVADEREALLHIRELAEVDAPSARRVHYVVALDSVVQSNPSPGSNCVRGRATVEAPMYTGALLRDRLMPRSRTS